MTKLKGSNNYQEEKMPRTEDRVVPLGIDKSGQQWEMLQKCNGPGHVPSLVPIENCTFFFFFKFKTNRQELDCRSNAMWLMISHNEWPWYQPAGSQLWRKLAFQLSNMWGPDFWFQTPHPQCLLHRHLKEAGRLRRSGHRSLMSMKFSRLIICSSHGAQYCKISTHVPSLSFFIEHLLMQRFFWMLQPVEMQT